MHNFDLFVTITSLNLTRFKVTHSSGISLRSVVTFFLVDFFPFLLPISFILFHFSVLGATFLNYSFGVCRSRSESKCNQVHWAVHQLKFGFRSVRTIMPVDPVFPFSSFSSFFAAPSSSSASSS